MRYTPTYCVRQGSILAQSILDANGRVLLNKGVKLEKAYLRRLLQLGVPGVFIADELSGDLEIKSVLAEELRTKVVSSIKNAFMDAPKKKSKTSALAKTQELKGLAENIVEEILSSNSVMVNLIDIKVFDDYTFFHCMQVAILSVILGIGAGLSRVQLVKLAISALMHDIGKVFIPKEVINKAGPLSPAEYEDIKNHPKRGFEYLQENYKLDALSMSGVLDHHERYDGSGYPNGKKGTEISEFGRIIAVADVYDALISDRSYRKGLFASEAMEYILGNSGVMFDPKIVDVMNRKVALFPVGTCVLLSNGATGLVMENYESFGQRPRLKVFLEDDVPVEPYILDLLNDYSALGITVVATAAV